MDYGKMKNEKNIIVCNILGVNIAAINMEWLKAFTNKHIKELSGEYLCVSNVHTTVTAWEDPEYRDIQNGGVMAVPDGVPLVWVSHWRGFKQTERTDGPRYMVEMLKESVKLGYRHFFYGSTQETLNKMRAVLDRDYPEVQVVGMYSPPFRSLTEEEDEAIIQMINETKADFVWVGLGAPKQEIFMAAHRGKINGFMVGIGAGFDYLAENIKRAPMWMQKCSLEWFYRMLQDPKRLFWRYVRTNAIFVWQAIIRKR